MGESIRPGKHPRSPHNCPFVLLGAAQIGDAAVVSHQEFRKHEGRVDRFLSDQGLPDNYIYKNFLARAAEEAVFSFTNLPPRDIHNQEKRPDIAPCIEVRFRNDPKIHELYVKRGDPVTAKPEDPSEYLYVLVFPMDVAPRGFQLMGWQTGEYVKAYGDAHTFKDSWLLPPSKLNPMSSLMFAVKDWRKKYPHLVDRNY